MNKFIFFFFFIVEPITVFSQKQNHAYDYALERVKNKSWYIEKYCKNDTCERDYEKQYKYYFRIEDHFTDHFETEYKNYMECTSVCQTIYEVDTFTYTVRETVRSDIPCFVFIDSDTQKKDVYAVGIICEGLYTMGALSFLSDSEFTISPVYDMRSYYKLYKTPPEFYELYNIHPQSNK